jgi:hypothetical protein
MVVGTSNKQTEDRLELKVEADEEGGNSRGHRKPTMLEGFGVVYA